MPALAVLIPSRATHHALLPHELPVGHHRGGRSPGAYPKLPHCDEEFEEDPLAR